MFGTAYIAFSSVIGSWYIGNWVGRASGWLFDKVAEKLK
jgi:hypothetical protein